MGPDACRFECDKAGFGFADDCGAVIGAAAAAAAGCSWVGTGVRRARLGRGVKSVEICPGRIVSVSVVLSKLTVTLGRRCDSPQAFEATSEPS